MLAASPPENFAELWDQLGNVPLKRIRLFPSPGTATTDDVTRLCHREPKRLCELVDGVLVEKVMGSVESRIAARLIQILANYIDEHDLGILSCPDGPYRVAPDQVRFPDVAFIAYENIPPDADPNAAIPDWIPSLAVEVLSESNTKAEMDRKLQDYFTAGVKIVWYVDPASRTVCIYRSPTDAVIKTEPDELEGEPVLPGLRISIKDWFDRAFKVRRS